MQDCGKEELGYINQHDLNEEDNTGLDEEEEEVSTQTENADIIHSGMNDNETDTNQYTLKQLFSCSVVDKIQLKIRRVVWVYRCRLIKNYKNIN